MSRIRLSACRPGAGNAGLGLYFAACNRLSGVWACLMDGLDRSINAPVHLSTLFRLRLSCRNLTQSTDVVDGDPCGCSTSVKRRTFKPAACAIDDRVGSNHRRASDDSSDARRWSLAQLAPVAARCLDLSARGSRLTLKPSESFRATPYPLSTLPWDLGAKRATGSGQMASWLSG